MEKNDEIIGRNLEDLGSPGNQRISKKLDDPICQDFFEAVLELNTTRVVDKGT